MKRGYGVDESAIPSHQTDWSCAGTRSPGNLSITLSAESLRISTPHYVTLQEHLAR